MYVAESRVCEGGEGGVPATDSFKPKFVCEKPASEAPVLFIYSGDIILRLVKKDEHFEIHKYIKSSSAFTVILHLSSLSDLAAVSDIIAL